MDRRDFITKSIMGAAALGIAPADVFSAAPGIRPEKQALPIPTDYKRKLERSVRLVRELMEETSAALQDLIYVGPRAFAVWWELCPGTAITDRFTDGFGLCWRHWRYSHPAPQSLMDCKRKLEYYPASCKNDLLGRAEVDRFIERRLACRSQTEIHLITKAAACAVIQDYELEKAQSHVCDTADVLEHALFSMAPLPSVKLAIYDGSEQNSNLERAVFQRLFQNAKTIAIYKSYPIPGDPDFMSGRITRMG